MKGSRRVCFISPHSYSLFNPSTRYVFGGSEVRAWLLGRGLANLQGYRVSFAVIDHGQKPVEVFEDITVYADAYFKQENPLLNSKRFLTRYALSALRKIQHFIPLPITEVISVGKHKVPLKRFETYRKIDADLYFTFGVGDYTAELVSYMKSIDKPLVLFIGSDGDLSDSYINRPMARNPYGSQNHLCRFTIDNSNFIIVQSETQARKLKKVFKRDSLVLKNPIDTTDVNNNSPRKQHFLWIGKSDMIKRPDLLVEAAKRSPGAKFVMVMNRSSPKIFDTIINNKPDNVSIIESVPFNDMDSLFNETHALINTSEFEGFPNTFLQAGKHGVPILSLQVDPDSFIERYMCGVAAKGCLDELISKFKLFETNNKIVETWGRNIKRYILENHSLDSITAKLDQFISEVLQ